MSLFIEPCCYDRQLSQIVASLESESVPRSVATFFTSGDLPLDTLISYFVHITPSCEVILCLPTVDAKTLYTLDHLLSKHDGTGRRLIRHLDLITTPTVDNFKLITDHLGHHLSERFAVTDDQIAFRCLLLQNDHRQFLLTGSMNQHARYAKQLYTLTTHPGTCADTLRILRSITRVAQYRQTKTPQQP